MASFRILSQTSLLSEIDMSLRFVSLYLYSSLEDSERLGGSVSGDGVRRDAQPDFVDRQQRLGRGRKEPLQVRSRPATVNFTASVASLMKLFTIVKITTLATTELVAWKITTLAL